MHRVVYSLAGDPKPLIRARTVRRGDNFHFYDPSADVKLIAGITLQKQHGDRPAYEGPLGLFITFYFPIPKTMRKKLSPQQWHLKRPDNSNCVKLIEDICQDIGMFKDDAQIARIFSDKVYDHSPRTEFIIHELGPQRTLAVDYGAL